MPGPRQRSVRRQLLILLLSAVSGAWVVAASVSFRDARHELSEVLDAHLAQTASLISVQRAGAEDHDEVDTEHAPVLHRYGRRVMFQVWEGGTVLGLHSQNAPSTLLSPIRDGFSDATVGGARWRVVSTWDARDRATGRRLRRTILQLQVAEGVTDELTGSLLRENT